MPKTIIHTATGEFRDHKGRLMWELDCQGWAAMGCPPMHADHSVITVATKPDQRTQRWNGSAVVARAAQDIAKYDQCAADAVVDGGVTPQVQALIACVAECCDLSETDARARFTRHLRRLHRKAKGL